MLGLSLKEFLEQLDFLSLLMPFFLSPPRHGVCVCVYARVEVGLPLIKRLKRNGNLY